MNDKRILIVDDERPIVDILKFNLEKEGFATTVAYDGEQAINVALSVKPDLILLDLMLPKIDGFNVCKEIRKHLTCPIIMLTAKEEVVDKIIGLELGADDYMTKPFSIREVIARVKANLRKHVLPENEEEKKSSKNKIKIKDMIIDPERYIAIIGDKTIDLTIKEFELLKMLSSAPNQVFTREQILRGVWGYDFYGDARTVDVTVRRLREKIEKSTADPQYVQTKRGMGYYVSN
ncbi:MAG: response regulator transcription factor [Clostridia bacterium]|jgi:two-component system response regulator VicR|nr:response regulator transcription factor [Clostridia bacterium]